MGVISIILCVFMCNGLGFLWWSPMMFGKIWADIVYPGVSIEEKSKDMSPYIHMVAGLAHAGAAILIQLVMAYVTILYKF